VKGILLLGYNARKPFRYTNIHIKTNAFYSVSTPVIGKQCSACTQFVF
jgi:hypothetical protein